MRYTKQKKNNEFDIAINDAYYNHMTAYQRYQIFFGGSSSGKSYWLSQRTVFEVMQGVNYLIVRKVGNTIRKSVFNEIVKAISNMGVSYKFTINKSDMVITYIPLGSQIIFSGTDDVEKLKSITPAKGVIESIWCEEATELAYEDLKQLDKRLRGHSRFSKKIILSFNPILKTHWIYKEFFADCWDESKRLYADDNKLILKTTYKDNNFLTEQDIYNLENETDEFYYNVYTCGNWGILGNVVFKNWETRDLSSVAGQFDRIYCGVDFGFNDPNAFIKVHVDNDKKEIYVLDEIYRSGISIEEFGRDIQTRISNLQYIHCDSAEPRSIHALNQMGIRAQSVKKGPDSITYGIRFLQQYKIIIDTKCQNFINEISQYHYKENKDGEVMEVPVDKNNHLLDSLRYSVNDLIMGSQANATVNVYRK